MWSASASACAPPGRCHCSPATDELGDGVELGALAELVGPELSEPDAAQLEAKAGQRGDSDRLEERVQAIEPGQRGLEVVGEPLEVADPLALVVPRVLRVRPSEHLPEPVALGLVEFAVVEQAAQLGEGSVGGLTHQVFVSSGRWGGIDAREQCRRAEGARQPRRWEGGPREASRLEELSPSIDANRGAPAFGQLPSGRLCLELGARLSLRPRIVHPHGEGEIASESGSERCERACWWRGWSW